MDIAGVAQTAQILPSQQAQQMQQPQETQATNKTTGADVVNLSAQMSTQVLDMAQRQFEDAANQLISSMASATGIGQNVDVTV